MLGSLWSPQRQPVILCKMWFKWMPDKISRLWFAFVTFGLSHALPSGCVCSHAFLCFPTPSQDNILTPCGSFNWDSLVSTPVTSYSSLDESSIPKSGSLSLLALTIDVNQGLHYDNTSLSLALCFWQELTSTLFTWTLDSLTQSLSLSLSTLTLTSSSWD